MTTNNPNTAPNTPPPASTEPKAEEKPPKDWSIMVYMAGGRDISDEARESLLRMKVVGTTSRINVVAQFDSGSEGTSTKRYLLQPLENAIWIETLLRQACVAVAAASGPEKSAVGLYFYQRLVDALPDKYPSSDNGDPPRKKFQEKYPADQMIELLKYSPDQFKISVLDFLLDPDLDNKGDKEEDKQGNQGDTNAGHPKVLMKFVTEAIKKHPAKNNMVIIWGHGNGLSVAFDFPGSPVVGEGDPLSANELSEALKAAKVSIDQVRTEKGLSKKDHAIDIVGFNSCSLGTIEVYYGLREYVNLGIASEGFTPKTSWPYDKILKDLDEAIVKAKEESVTPADFAQNIVGEYIKHYKGSVKATEQRRKARRAFGIPLGASFDLNKGPDLASAKGPDLGIPNKGPDLGVPNKGPDLGTPVKGPDLGPQAEVERRGIDLSVCVLTNSTKVADTMKALVGKLNTKLEMDAVFSAVLAAHAIAQSYFNKDFTDLHDFCRALQIFCSDPEIRLACNEVMDSIKAMCAPEQKGSVGEDVKNSSGVSIYFPWDDWDEQTRLCRYGELTFPKDTGWNAFLRKYRDLVNKFESGAFESGALKLNAPPTETERSNLLSKLRELVAGLERT